MKDLLIVRKRSLVRRPKIYVRYTHLSPRVNLESYFLVNPRIFFIIFLARGASAYCSNVLHRLVYLLRNIMKINVFKQSETQARVSVIFSELLEGLLILSYWRCTRGTHACNRYRL